jgi:hypothetical protein
MWFDRIGTRLRALYRGTSAPVPGDRSAADALERQLMAEHAVLYPARTGARGFVAAHRWALASVGVGLAVAGACQVPVDYEREFGASVTCEVARELWPEARLDEVAGELADRFAAERVAIRVHDDHGPTRSFRIDLWGADLDDAGLIVALADHAPWIPADACVRTALTGTVHGTLGGRLGHDLLDLDLDRADAEATRAEILETLAREGHSEADVQVYDDGAGRREVKVRIETHRRE